MLLMLYWCTSDIDDPRNDHNLLLVLRVLGLEIQAAVRRDRSFASRQWTTNTSHTSSQSSAYAEDETGLEAQLLNIVLNPADDPSVPLPEPEAVFIGKVAKQVREKCLNACLLTSVCLALPSCCGFICSCGAERLSGALSCSTWLCAICALPTPRTLPLPAPLR